MSVTTLPRGCPLCGGPVTGNQEVLWLCGSCRLFFSRPRRSSVRKQQLSEFVEYVLAPSGTYHVSSCKYARRIESPATISASQAAEFRPCGCVKRS